jgi:heme exporter protein A
MADSLLEAKALFCERDDRVLFAELSFSLAQGEIVQVQGRNGAGKSTLLRMLSGLFSSYEGEILYEGVPIAEIAVQYQSDLAFVGHKLPVKELLTARENLEYYTSLCGDWSVEGMLQSFDLLGLRGYEDSYCSDMSAGQKRRVALARLWLSKARIWILDEPFTALDIDAVAMLENFFEKAAMSGKLVIFTSHHLPKIKSLRTIALGKAGAVYG